MPALAAAHQPVATLVVAVAAARTTASGSTPGIRGVDLQAEEDQEHRGEQVS
jgi:hypothetical protein